MLLSILDCVIARLTVPLDSLSIELGWSREKAEDIAQSLRRLREFIEREGEPPPRSIYLPNQARIMDMMGIASGCLSTAISEIDLFVRALQKKPPQSPE